MKTLGFVVATFMIFIGIGQNYERMVEFFKWIKNGFKKIFKKYLLSAISCFIIVLVIIWISCFFAEKLNVTTNYKVPDRWYETPYIITTVSICLFFFFWGIKSLMDWDLYKN